MSTDGQPATRECKPIIPALGPFYVWSRDVSYLLIRVTAGGMLLVHGISKLMYSSIPGFAAGALARRGIEPALPLAYVVWTIETVGAVCIMLGLFTRFFAAAIAIELLIAMFAAHWVRGFSVSAGGYEYVLFLGIVMFAIALRGGGPYSVDRLIGKEL